MKLFSKVNFATTHLFQFLYLSLFFFFVNSYVNLELKLHFAYQKLVFIFLNYVEYLQKVKFYSLLLINFCS